MKGEQRPSAAAQMAVEPASTSTTVEPASTSTTVEPASAPTAVELSYTGDHRAGSSRTARAG